MKGYLNHVAIAVDRFEWYRSFFEECFGMEVDRTAKEAPNRVLWFKEGIQLCENLAASSAEAVQLTDHISIGVPDVPAAVAQALSLGCTSLPNGAHWFALPNGVKLELKPLPKV